MVKQIVGLSCSHVGIGVGGTIAMLARVAIVDRRGQVIYDTYVQPTAPVESYRTATTGLDASYFTDARSFDEVQAAVAGWIEGKAVVGHKLWNDLQILGLSHPTVDTRDVALFLPFRAALQRPNDILGLQTLVWLLMRRRIQETIVDQLENARASIDLFRSHEEEWEAKINAEEWPCALPPPAFSRCFT